MAQAGRKPSKNNRTKTGANSKTAKGRQGNRSRPADKFTTKKVRKKNGRKSYLTLVVFIGFIALLLTFIVVYGRFGAAHTDMIKCDLYFVNEENNEIETETRNIESGDNQTVLSKVITELQKGPKSRKLAKSLPDSIKVELLSYDPNERLLMIHLDDGYNSLSITEEVFCRSALVMTFTGLDFVDSVKLFVSGSELTKNDGQPFGSMSRDNVLTSSSLGSVSVNTEYQTFILYFSDSDGMYLVPESRTIVVNPNISHEIYVLQELFKGPADQGLISALPSLSEDKIKATTTDGICYVDLGSDFLSKIQPGSTNERLAIYSIVNSLTELNNIKKVQFLFGGVRADSSHTDFSAPFERNEDIIQ